MRIRDRREDGGTWWGRGPDGSWFRWDATLGDWEGPLPPPTFTTGEPVLSPATGADRPSPWPPPDALSPVDAWWNRNFPPFSGRRLAFLLVALPFISGLVELAGSLVGRDPSLARFLFSWVAGSFVIGLSFLPGMREYAVRVAPRAPWTRATVPVAPPVRVAAPAPAPSRAHDFLVALPFCAAMVLVLQLTVSGVGEAFSPPALATQVVGGIVAATIVSLRSSMWGLAVFSVVAGLIGGLALELLQAMTFSSGGGFLIGWAAGSVLAFLFGLPMWDQIRRLEARGIRFPMWIVMGGSLVLVAGASLSFLADG